MLQVLNYKTYKEDVYLHEFALKELVLSYDKGLRENYKLQYYHFLEQVKIGDAGEYPMVYFKAADPEAREWTDSAFKIVE